LRVRRSSGVAHAARQREQPCSRAGKAPARQRPHGYGWDANTMGHAANGRKPAIGEARTSTCGLGAKWFRIRTRMSSRGAAVGHSSWKPCWVVVLLVLLSHCPPARCAPRYARFPRTGIRYSPHPVALCLPSLVLERGLSCAHGRIAGRGQTRRRRPSRELELPSSVASSRASCPTAG
jgi:hypothetical protein